MRALDAPEAVRRSGDTTSGDHSLISSLKLHAGSLKVIDVAQLHLFEVSEQPAGHRRVLTPGVQRENNVSLLSDELEAETDRLLGLSETSL